MNFYPLIRSITSRIVVFHVVFQITFQSKKKKKVPCFHGEALLHLCKVSKHEFHLFHKILTYSNFSNRLVR